MEDETEIVNDLNQDEVSKNRITNVIYAIRPELLIENCFGIFRYYLVDGELQAPNWKMKSYGIFIASAHTILFFIYVKYPNNNGISGNMDFVETFPCIVILIQYIAAVLGFNFFANSVNIQICNLLAEIDSMLQVETFDRFHEDLRHHTNKCLLILILSHIVNIVVDVVSYSDMYWAAAVFPLIFIQKTEVLIFCLYIDLVKARLKVFNFYVKYFIEEQDKKVVHVFTVREKKTAKNLNVHNFIGSPSEGNAKIRDLATVYDIIGKICFKINKAFNLQLFLTLVETFVYVIVTIWIALYSHKVPSYQNQLINVVYWCISTICNVAVISFTCERMLQVRNETKVLVNKIIMNYDLPKTMRVQAKAFMELVDAWPLRIYIYDMFSIDITLMLKFISVSTTYLIVIIQISHLV